MTTRRNWENAMAFVPIVNTLKVNIRWRIESQTVENVLYFRRNETWEPLEMETMGNAIGIWVQDELLPELSNEITYTGLYLTDMSSETGFFVDYPASPGEVGGIAADALPSTNAAVISFLTTSRGRSYRGRMYLPGIAETSVNGSILNTSNVSTLTAAFDALDGFMPFPDAVHVVASLYSGGAPRAGGVTTVVSSYRVNPVLGTQRRRRVGVGS